jgi:hypothetical protein
MPLVTTGEVNIALAKNGGWDLTVVVHGRVVARRHCAEWHHVEDTREWLASRFVQPSTRRRRAHR